MDKLNKAIPPNELDHLHVPPKGRAGQEAVPVSDHTFHIKQSEGLPHTEEWKTIATGDVTPLPLNKRGMGSSSKSVLKNPQGATFLAKAYHEPLPKQVASYDSGGWAEMATQALYKAGEIKHLCQQSSVVMHGDKPVIATRMEPHATDYEPPEDPSEVNTLSLDATKIGMMDFLSNNTDRNSTNFLMRKESGANIGLLAIDHAGCFQYAMPNIFGEQNYDDPSDHLQEYLRGDSDFSAFARLKAWESPYLEHGVKWWAENGPFIRHEMKNQLSAITDPKVHDHIRKNFNERASALDRLASEWPDHRDSDHFSRKGGLGDIVNAPLYRFGKEE